MSLKILLKVEISLFLKSYTIRYAEQMTLF